MGKWRSVPLLVCLLLLYGCPAEHAQAPSRERPLFERISVSDFPSLQEDIPADSLRPAIQKSLEWYSRIPEERPLAFGNKTLPAKIFRESLSYFLFLLDAGNLDAKRIAEEFDLFRVIPPEQAGKLLVTGYYEPVLDGSLKREGVFRWPLYGVPEDLVVVELDRFDPAKFRGERLTGRVEKGRLVPYYSRAEIDGKKILEKPAATVAIALAWLKDPVDCFFLHVQGSGMISLPDGRQIRVGYAGANGRPYYSIGKTLFDIGAIPREEMSLQAIRKYLQSHPESQNEIMWKNESYVFFRLVSEGPIGSLGTVITRGRSIATDPKLHPRGAIAFLISEKPRYDSSGNIETWDRLSRWVLSQDTGGAIKGAGRVDLFCGTGADAESAAGPMKQPGELYYLIKKDLMGADGN